MNKFKYYLVCTIVASALAGAGAAQASCVEKCECGAKCNCGVNGEPYCGDSNEAYEYSSEVRERAAINFVKQFLGALQAKDYAKAYGMLDEFTAKDITEHYSVYVADVDKSVTVEKIKADFKVGGPLAARYWEWYKKDIHIQDYKNLDKATFTNHSQPGAERYNISSPFPGGNWSVSNDRPRNEMNIALPQG
ncbi:hypothetical protein IJT93_12575 [bacterium]|nr:hypothetical protein [bacterium]